MLYLYDKAICEDLEQSFNRDNMDNPNVRVIDPGLAVDVLAQIQSDDIKYPAVIVTRQTDINVDNSRMNFTRLHRGIATVIEDKTNNIYYEQVLPIDLRYTLTVLTTNVPDRDELIRELLFKYSQMYFLTIHLPYESRRQLRFGIEIDSDTSIQYYSATLEYIQSGQLYQSIISLRCEGCILATYTPMHVKRTVPEVVARAPGQEVY